MTVQLKKSVTSGSSVAITVVDRAAFKTLSAQLPEATRRWLEATGFSAAPDSFALVPGADGRLGQVFAGVAHASQPFALAALPLALPEGDYQDRKSVV